MAKCNCGSGLETDYEDRHGCAACRGVSTQAIIDAAMYSCVRDGLRVRLAVEGDRVVVSEVFARVASRGQDSDWQWVPAAGASVSRFVQPVIVDAAGIKPPITDRLPPPLPSTFLLDVEATTAMAYSRDADDEIARVCSYEYGPAVEGVRQRRWGVGSTGQEDESPVTGVPAEAPSYYWPDGSDFPWLPLGQPSVDELCRTAMWLRWLEVQRVVLESLQGRPPDDDSRLLATAAALDWKNPEIRYLDCTPEQGGRIVVAVEALPGKIPQRSGVRLRFREEMTVERDAAGRVRVVDDYAVHVATGLVSYRPG